MVEATPFIDFAPYPFPSEANKESEAYFFRCLCIEISDHQNRCMTSLHPIPRSPAPTCKDESTGDSVGCWATCREYSRAIDLTSGREEQLLLEKYGSDHPQELKSEKEMETR